MPTPILDPRTIATTTDTLRAAITWAILAPSGHNTQPWRFRIAGDAVELYADRTRALPVADPDNRELTIGCGAALLHLRLALRHAGVTSEVDVLPEASDPDLLARVRLGLSAPPNQDEETLFAATPLRRTNRQPFAGRPLPQDLPTALEAAARQEGAWLHFVPKGEERTAVADLVAEGDCLQWADQRFRRELAAWLRPARRGDGMPSLYMHGMGPLVVRTLNLGGRMAKQDRELADAAPLLVVLGTDGDGPRDWLSAGQALARVLLRARAAGLDASYLNQPIQVRKLRTPLAATIGRPGRFPQLLLRMGYGPEVPRAPRRPVERVLVGES